MVSECECPGQRLLASECDLSLLMKITPGQHLNTGVVMSLALARPCLHCVTSYNQGEECHAPHSDHSHQISSAPARSQISVPVLTLLISDLCSCINIVALLSRSSSGDKQSLVSHLECGVTGEVTGDWLVFLFEVTNLMNPHNYQMHSNEL